MCEHGRERRRCKDCRFARAAADAQEKAAAALEKAAAALGAAAALESEMAAPAPAAAPAETPECGVCTLCAFVSLNHAILNKSTRGRRGTVKK